MTAHGAVPATALGLAVSALISLAAPVVVFLVCRKRMALPARNITIGVAVFLVFVLVLEGALNRFVLVWNPASTAWFRVHGPALAAYGALAAAVFEETGRLLAMRYVAKPTGDPESWVSYGLGHGGIEAVIIGAVAQAQMVVFVLLQQAGKLDATLGAKIPAAALAKLHGQIAHLDLATALAGGVERVCALLLQLALSALVWRAVWRRQWR